MGCSKKHQVEGGIEIEGKKWVIAGIAVRSPLRSITMKPEEIKRDDDSGEACSTTPTAKGSRIPEKLSCPPAPMKRRSSAICHYNGARVFFTPPDLDSVFMQQVERAN